MTSGTASRPSWTEKVYSWCTVPRYSAALRAAIRSGEPGRPMLKECSRGHAVSVDCSSAMMESVCQLAILYLKLRSG